jgi:hypothetical protein
MVVFILHISLLYVKNADDKLWMATTGLKVRSIYAVLMLMLKTFFSDIPFLYTVFIMHSPPLKAVIKN